MPYESLAETVGALSPEFALPPVNALDRALLRPDTRHLFQWSDGE